jgi:TolA-binding protein
MKKYIIFIIILFSFSTTTSAAENDILREIKNLREDMNKRFEQVDKQFEQIDKRFEQNERRFEQIEKRLDFMQSLIIVIIGIVFTSPFLVEYMARKRSEKDKESIERTEKVIITLKEVAQKDARLAKALKLTGLL